MPALAASHCVVSQMLDAQRAGFLSTGMATASRLICRVLPLDNLCKPFLEDFRQLAQAVLPPHLGPDVAATTWALEFKARNTNTLKKEAVLEVLDAIIPKGHHKVNLNDPAKCILVEVQPSWCGLSVVENWARLKKYNLHALTTPEDNKAKVSNAVFEEIKKPEEPNAHAEVGTEAELRPIDLQRTTNRIKYDVSKNGGIFANGQILLFSRRAYEKRDLNKNR
eukprot:s1339_g22.t1